jgi:hypothetical protein
MARIDLTGQAFGRLVVVSEIGSSFGRGAVRRWLCRCDCGSEKVIRQAELTTGRTRSCTCLRREVSSARAKTHGRSKTPEYRAWRGMWDRCMNPKVPQWPRYGGRGIFVVNHWAWFENFLEDMGDRPGAGYSLDRKDNDGPYAPDNCRWVEMREQTNNRSSNRLIDYFGHSLTLAQWSALTGIGESTIDRRLKRGWSVKDALTRPIRGGGKGECDGQSA